MSFAALPDIPYYAVIFAARRTEGDHGYADMADQMEALAATMPGYLGFESARDVDGFGLAISYWESEEAIANWKKHADHKQARDRGRTQWYEHYTVRVARVERSYAMNKNEHE